MPGRQSKNWLFTINNPREHENPELWQNKVSYCVWQIERGEQAATDHYQGYLQTPKKVTLAWLKKELCDRGHYELRRGTHQQALDYCTKEDTRLSGPFTFGRPTRGAGQRNDLQALKEALDCGKTEAEIAQDDETFPQWIKYYRGIERYKRISQGRGRDWPTRTIVYWGPPGTGKSSRALVEGGQSAFWLPKPHSNGSVWWDGYEGQETVVIDEFYGWIPRDLMCRICDRYPLLVETKGGSTQFLAKKVIITSNKPPQDWWRCGLGAMERRLKGDLGQVYEIAMYVDPNVPLQAQYRYACRTCLTEEACTEPNDQCLACRPLQPRLHCDEDPVPEPPPGQAMQETIERNYAELESLLEGHSA